MPTRVDVKGLSDAKANFEKLGTLVQREIGRQSLREAAWALAKPMRAATYTTFLRRTGAIRSGLSVSIQREPKDASLTGYVEEYAQSIAGPATPFATLVRKRLGAKRRKSTPTSYVALWWRYLEFGTGPRRAVRTPTFLRSGKIARTAKGQARQLKSAQRWLATASRGGIKSRSWIRPVFGGVAPQSITSFRDTIFKLIDAAVSAMPK
jgi:HK97 gp10 family phage protein